MAQWEACESNIYTQFWGSVPRSLGKGFMPGTGAIELIDFPRFYLYWATFIVNVH